MSAHLDDPREPGADTSPYSNAPPDPEMVVARTLAPDHRPSWSDVTSAGTFRVEPGGSFDRHFHDCDEYWLVFGGRARVVVGTTPYEVEAGDIVCTPTGTDHDIVGVYETLEAFWFEGHTPRGDGSATCIAPRKTAKGHDVPALEG